MPQHSSSYPPNYYEILQLPRVRPPQELVKEDVKAAYHRALLLYHPDKTAQSTATIPIAVDQTSYTVDDILAAYENLADPRKRRAYDESLDVEEKTVGDRGTHPGVEALDLEDLVFDEDNNTWHHNCRCGNDEGYVLTEGELEKESQRGEIYVGCRGCSLFIKVVFGVAGEEEVSG
jgi:DnaJ-class molecular chaperone